MPERGGSSVGAGDGGMITPGECADDECRGSTTSAECRRDGDDVTPSTAHSSAGQGQRGRPACVRCRRGNAVGRQQGKLPSGTTTLLYSLLLAYCMVHIGAGYRIEDRHSYYVIYSSYSVPVKADTHYPCILPVHMDRIYGRVSKNALVRMAPYVQ